MNPTSCHNLANSCIRGANQTKNGEDSDESASESPELSPFSSAFRKNVSLSFLIGQIPLITRSWNPFSCFCDKNNQLATAATL